MELRCSACTALLERVFSLQASSCLAGLGTSVEHRRIEGLWRWRPSHGRRNRETVRWKSMPSEVHPSLLCTQKSRCLQASQSFHNRDFALFFGVPLMILWMDIHHHALHSVRPRTAQPAPQQGIPTECLLDYSTTVFNCFNCFPKFWRYTICH